jgi:hypothetical protein
VHLREDTADFGFDGLLGAGVEVDSHKVGYGKDFAAAKKDFAYVN